MGPSLSEQFDQFAHWRQGMAGQLAHLRQWLKACEALDAGLQEQLQRLEHLLRSDKVCVAFVAEFSRGKSELINAVFFAHYGRRIMPATPGRTTMCPTELGYEAGIGPCLRLLPVETRAQADSLAEWRMRPAAWRQLPLDMHDPDQLARAMAHVAQVQKVSRAQAQQLGFWSDAPGADNPSCDAQGRVEIPQWRHALLNMAHPLLQQGLVIVDTPGLNAVGTEPELTINLIGQAHAVVFLLAADAGVTKSDLAIWNAHLLPCHRAGDAHLVVLNKIDTLWGSLDSGTEVQAQLSRQRAQSAQILGVDPARIVPLSAQKGLMGKIESNAALLKSSGLPLFENLLAQGILAQRQRLLHNLVQAGVQQLLSQTARGLQVRLQDVQEQVMELRSLRSKNTVVIENMRQRIAQEQQAFEASAAKIVALRNVHLKLMNQAFEGLGATALRQALQPMASVIESKGLKLGVRKVYAAVFEHLHARGQGALAQAREIQTMLAATFQTLNTEFGFALQPPPALHLHDFDSNLAQIQESFVQYGSWAYAVPWSQPAHGQRMVKALHMRLRAVFESASNDLDLWSKSATAQLDAQLKERTRSFARRMEAVERIRHAADGLEERLGELASVEQQLHAQQAQLQQKVQQLLAPQPAPGLQVHATP